MTERQVFMRRVITGLIFGILFWGVFLYAPPILFSLLLALVALLIASFEWTNFYNIDSWSFWLILPIYPLLPFALLIAMNHVAAYRPLLFFLFAIAFAHDTGSYIVGKMIGKHKIWPAISPNKTWEGFIGGFITTVVVAYFIRFLTPFTAIEALFAGAIIAGGGFIGDIIVSAIKRDIGLKDTGNLIPGHGGILDRIDSLAIAAPSFFYFVYNLYYA